MSEHEHDPEVCGGTGDHDGQPVDGCDECASERLTRMGYEHGRRVERAHALAQSSSPPVHPQDEVLSLYIDTVMMQCYGVRNGARTTMEVLSN